MWKSLLHRSLMGLAFVALVASSQSSLAANHVIVARGNTTWHSPATGKSSTTGGEPLIIEVAKGDIIEFQVPGGHHGVVTIAGAGNANPAPALKLELVIACGKAPNADAVLQEVDCNGEGNFNRRFIGTLKLEVLNKFSADTNFWCFEHEGTMWGIIRLK